MTWANSGKIIPRIFQGRRQTAAPGGSWLPFPAD
jgi:hypothetical protein